MESIKLLEKLCMADGISGNEDEVRDIIKNEIKSCSDEIKFDNLGSIIGIKKGEKDGLKIGLFAHMDEVGFIIKSIDDNGFIKVFPIGAWNIMMTTSMEVRVTNSLGEKFIGVLTTDKSGEIRSFDDFYVDLGFNSSEELRKRNIEEGNMITPYRKFQYMGEEKVLAKALDDRLGCVLAVETFKDYLDSKNTLFCVGTVQEEAGTRGGETSVDIINPDIAIVIDIASSKDTPNQKNGRRIGGGPALVYANKLFISNKKVYNFVKERCKENDIKFQFDIMNGGTDSGPVHLHKEGVITIELIIPIRNAHTSVSIFDINDFIEVKKLIKKILEELNRDIYNEFKKY